MAEWSIEENEGGYCVEGCISQSNAEEFCRALADIPKGSRLELLDLDIEDGVSMARIVSTLRLLRPVVLVEAPQMLAHTLYKTFMLSTGITLMRPREEDDFRD